MKARIVLISMILCISGFTYARELSKDFKVAFLQSTNAINFRNELSGNYLYSSKRATIVDPETPQIHFRNESATFGRKALRGSALCFGIETISTAVLFLEPESVSQWDMSEALKWNHIKDQYIKSYTLPPVIDKDILLINYVGHPYQGAYYYNAVRSQNATKWQSALFCLAHTLLWEYGLEAGFEQPSIQDLLVTPTTGVILGELIHRATLRMGKNGYSWYEKTLICLLNPMFALNNGFNSTCSKIQILP